MKPQVLLIVIIFRCNCISQGSLWWSFIGCFCFFSNCQMFVYITPTLLLALKVKNFLPRNKKGSLIRDEICFLKSYAFCRNIRFQVNPQKRRRRGKAWISVDISRDRKRVKTHSLLLSDGQHQNVNKATWLSTIMLS